jgi:hypothetical protein
LQCGSSTDWIIGNAQTSQHEFFMVVTFSPVQWRRVHRVTHCYIKQAYKWVRAQAVGRAFVRHATMIAIASLQLLAISAPCWGHEAHFVPFLNLSAFD